jgi:transcriptional pleiotropic regulator of transition state genes
MTPVGEKNTKEVGRMADTGIVRRVDDLGRIVIPMELRRTLGINVKDPISISTEGDRIILQKHRDACAICGSEEHTLEVKGRAVCEHCVEEIKEG